MRCGGPEERARSCRPCARRAPTPRTRPSAPRPRPPSGWKRERRDPLPGTRPVATPTERAEGRPLKDLALRPRLFPFTHSPVRPYPAARGWALST